MSYPANNGWCPKLVSPFFTLRCLALNVNGSYTNYYVYGLIWIRTTARRERIARPVNTPLPVGAVGNLLPPPMRANCRGWLVDGRGMRMDPQGVGPPEADALVNLVRVRSDRNAIDDDPILTRAIT